MNWNMNCQIFKELIDCGTKFLGGLMVIILMTCCSLTAMAAEYVDLGLPSGTLWATCNLGAGRPTQSGFVFAWGETVPHNAGTYNFSWGSYSLCRGSGQMLSKYCLGITTGKVDNRTTLLPEDDAATAILGSNWRMPTVEETYELYDTLYTKWTFYALGNAEFGGVAGYKVQSRMKGYTEKYIFLPASGFYEGTNSRYANEQCAFWTSSVRNSTQFCMEAYTLTMRKSSHFKTYNRCMGMNVRPVYAASRTEEIQEREYVDMGLPSGTLWAKTNVGASQPEEPGDYIAWGEIYGLQRQKEHFNNKHYRFIIPGDPALLKYYTSPNPSYTDFADNKCELDSIDDAAAMRWGGEWEMPTDTQFAELIDSVYSIVTYDYQNGVYGLRVTSRANGNSLFFPAGGAHSLVNAIPDDITSPIIDGIYAKGENGYFWTCTRSGDYMYAKAMGFFEESKLEEIEGEYDYKEVFYKVHKLTEGLRYYGYNIRPVRYQYRIPENPDNPQEPEEQTRPYVDLGLPSGTCWAMCNLDAETPTDFGGYYAWGETYGSKDGKTDFSWPSYAWSGTVPTDLYKYNNNSAYGYVDNMARLVDEDDAANVKWGEAWHIPSQEQFKELSNYTTVTAYEAGNTEFNGVAGRKFQSNVEGYEDKFIFLPEAGFYRDRRFYSGDLYYWTNEINTQVCYWACNNHMSIYNNSISLSSSDRCHGLTIRPVFIKQSAPSYYLAFDTGEGTPVDTLWLKNGEKITPPVDPQREGYTFMGWAPELPNFMPDSNLVVRARWSDVKPWDGSPYVDLGLPSGTRWATCNVGASQPTISGGYFAWGSTMIDQYSFSLDSYKYYNKNTSMYTKYCSNVKAGIVDNLTQLLPVDDAATSILGNLWCMPTHDDFEELCDTTYTQWIWYGKDDDAFGGVAGYMIRSKVEGHTDNFIFIPAAGFRYGTDDVIGMGSNITCWSSTAGGKEATSNALAFYGTSTFRTTYMYLERYRGANIRPVLKEKVKPKYTITFQNYDGTVLQTSEVISGTVPVYKGETPTREADIAYTYEFCGWTPAPKAATANATYTASYTTTLNEYTITFDTDGGTEIAQITQGYGHVIVAPKNPSKIGYTFAGWDKEIPAVMPGENMTIKALWTINSYRLAYLVDDKLYKEYNIEYGAKIKPEDEPILDGYTFSGWSEIPETMPAHEVNVTGAFTVNQYRVTFIVDGEIIQEGYLDYGTTIPVPQDPEKTGYTFMGWDTELVSGATVPDHDVTFTARFDVNSYRLTYLVDDKLYKEYNIEYGSIITPEVEPVLDGYTFSGWSEIPETMPAHDVEVTGSFTMKTSVSSVSVVNENVRNYNINGQRNTGKEKGIIIRNNKKVIVR